SWGRNLPESWGESLPESGGRSLPENGGKSLLESRGRSLPESWGESLPESWGESLPESWGKHPPRGGVDSPRIAPVWLLPRFWTRYPSGLGHCCIPPGSQADSRSRWPVRRAVGTSYRAG
ncbi:hypothetical protein FJY68_03155, partial [candidate division WOR-3 bacterium]|nr:hypothetical protein [candidate division WOR-3 bacterium]